MSPETSFLCTPYADKIALLKRGREEYAVLLARVREEGTQESVDALLKKQEVLETLTEEIEELLNGIGESLYNGESAFSPEYIKEGLAFMKEFAGMRDEHGVSRVNLSDMVQGLAGVGTPESMAFRRSIMGMKDPQGNPSVFFGSVAYGLAGVDTPESMAMRQEFIENGNDIAPIAVSLMGVATEESMAMRRSIIKKGAGLNSLAEGLAGVGTPAAMAMRRELMEMKNEKGIKRVSRDFLAYGLAGVGTPESMVMRRELLARGIAPGPIIQGLAGVITPEAMVMRRKIMEMKDTGGKRIADIDLMAQSLVGVGTKEAMAFRRELMKEGARLDYLLEGLAGITTKEASAMRKELTEMKDAGGKFCIDRISVARSLTGINTLETIAIRRELLRDGTDPSVIAAHIFDNAESVLQIPTILRKSARKR